MTSLNICNTFSPPAESSDYARKRLKIRERWDESGESERFAIVIFFCKLFLFLVLVNDVM